MKIIKIGRANSNDIVLHNEKVSAYHADILILDDGKMLLTDRNSSNGTFVGNQRLNPGEECSIKRGDYVSFADEDLNWSYVPAPDKYVGYKTIVNVGSLFRNDLVLDSSFVSRIHAVIKIDKHNNVFIRDLGSKNGTLVNGSKIAPKNDLRIKRGDNVICGDVDITNDLQKYFPKVLWKPFACAIAVAAVAAVFLLFFKPSIDPQEYRPAVAGVMGSFHYTARFTNNPMPELLNLTFDLESHQYTATAFFIDGEGRLATNRHVALPWDYLSEEDNNRLIQMAKKTLEENLPKYMNKEGDLITIKEVNSTRMVSAFSQYNLMGEKIVEYAIAQMKQAGDPESFTSLYSRINRIINTILTSPVEITGEMEDLYVWYAGKYYTHQDDLNRCYVESYKKDKDIDLAILQLNDKKTPSEVKRVFKIDECRETPPVPLKENYTIIGYPNGFDFAVDNTVHTLEPQIRECKCGKIPSKINFELQTEVVPGSSGSPIFDRKGRLVGIVTSKWNSVSTFGFACQAKYLKQLYYE